ncbi:MAG: hypothetical protein ACO29Z_08125, partial [Crocinitomicaceae bacterium]
MNKKQTTLLLLLTALYLLFEVSFNARLLDVVGGVATQVEIDTIEKYGRTLTGIAVSLFVLQALLKLFNNRQQDPGAGRVILISVTSLNFALSYLATPNGWSYIAKLLAATVIAGLSMVATNRIGKPSYSRLPSITSIIFVCVVSATCVYSSVENLVDHLVTKSSASFRHASLNIILIQKALVDGSVKIDGLTDGGTLFSRPEGKAFLALFPFMAVSVDRLDEKIRDAKHHLLTQSIEEKIGGQAGLYGSYRDVLTSTKKEWDTYNKATKNVPNVSEIQDREWNKY